MIEHVPTSILSEERCHLGEGPTYDAATDTAWWFDILEGRLFEARLASGRIKIHELGRMASALARIDASRQLIAAEDGFYIRSIADGAMALYRPLEADNRLTRSNDGRVHPSGTFWIGTMGRKAESRAGAIYALRRSLWRPLPEGALLDDVLAPMRAVLAGFRIVFDEKAVAFDRTSPDAAIESRRKTRTLAGNYQILGLEPRLLMPRVNPVWFQYLSHKVGRLIVPWALLMLLAVSIALALDGGYIYIAALAAQLGFYGLAAAGGWLSLRDRPARVALTFVLMNYAAIAGLAALRRGREVW